MDRTLTDKRIKWRKLAKADDAACRVCGGGPAWYWKATARYASAETRGAYCSRECGECSVADWRDTADAALAQSVTVAQMTADRGTARQRREARQVSDRVRFGVGVNAHAAAVLDTRLLDGKQAKALMRARARHAGERKRIARMNEAEAVYQYRRQYARDVERMVKEGMLPCMDTLAEAYGAAVFASVKPSTMTTADAEAMPGLAASVQPELQARRYAEPVAPVLEWLEARAALAARAGARSGGGRMRWLATGEARSQKGARPGSAGDNELEWILARTEAYQKVRLAALADAREALTLAQCAE